MKQRWTSSYPNPLTAPLRDFISRLRGLKFAGSSLIPDAIVAFVLSIVIILLSLFWVYGEIVNIQRRLLDFAIGAKNEMAGKSIVDKVPYTITFGIFLLIWVPFFLVCTPYYLIGLVGRALFGD